MVIHIQRDKALDIYSGIYSMLNNNEKRDFKFNHALIRTKSKIENTVKEISEVVKQYDKDMQNLRTEYCNKDENGKPIKAIIGNTVHYSGLETGANKVFDEEMGKIQTAKKDFLSGEIALEVFEIKDKKMIPEQMSGTEQESIMYLVEDYYNELQ